MKALTLKKIKKRPAKNPQDIELQKIIETNTINKNTLNKLIEKSIKQEPFDKKN